MVPVGKLVSVSSEIRLFDISNSLILAGMSSLERLDMMFMPSLRYCRLTPPFKKPERDRILLFSASRNVSEDGMLPEVVSEIRLWER